MKRMLQQVFLAQLLCIASVNAMEETQESTIDVFVSSNACCEASNYIQKKKLHRYVDPSDIPEEIQKTLNDIDKNARLIVWQMVQVAKEDKKNVFEMITSLKTKDEQVSTPQFTYPISRKKALKTLLKLEFISRQYIGVEVYDYSKKPSIYKAGLDLILKDQKEQRKKSKEIEKLKKTVKKLTKEVDELKSKEIESQNTTSHRNTSSTVLIAKLRAEERESKKLEDLKKLEMN